MKYRVAAVLKNFKYPIWGIRLQPVNPDRIFYFMAYTDLLGQVFNRLTVIEFIGQGFKGRSIWKCKCICGNQKILPARSLTKKHTQSCGCLTHGRPIHNGVGTRLYGIWADMKQRCYNTKCTNYKYYGQRGIIVCEDWKNDFSVFKNWSFQNDYKEYLEIERINNNGNYEPSNCKWATELEQAFNKRNNVFCFIKGEKLNTLQVEKKYGIPHHIVLRRIKKGWNEDRIIAPIGTRK